MFIDNNPSPLVASFDMGATPLTEIDMRVRIDRFTSVRAIAELADGSFEMRSTWVKASGGCSAPPAPSGGGKIGRGPVAVHRRCQVPASQHPPSE